MLPSSERILVIVMRHGATALNEGATRLRAWDDLLLNQVGEIEVQLAAMKLRKYQPKIIYSDDLSRTMQTAHLLAAGLGNIPVEVDYALRTSDMGQLTDMLDTTAAPYVEFWYKHPWEEPPGGGDSFNSFSRRYLAAHEAKREIARGCPSFCPSIEVVHGRNLALLHAHYMRINPWEAQMPLTSGIALVKSHPGSEDTFEFLTPTEAVLTDR